MNDGTPPLAGSGWASVDGRQGADPAGSEHAQHLYIHPQRQRRRLHASRSRRRTRRCCLRTWGPARQRHRASSRRFARRALARSSGQPRRSWTSPRSIRRPTTTTDGPIRRRRLPDCTRIAGRLIFVGANDGMIHAIDARTGYEVWAFIPYNLLPKLKTFRDGQGVDQFDYFVDSSPKLAEVKIERGVAESAAHRRGSWRNVLSDLRRHRSGHGTRSGPGRSFGGQHDAEPVRYAERVDRVQVGIPELRQLRSDLLGDVHRDGRARLAESSGCMAT